jgi:hypothetical protein
LKLHDRAAGSKKKIGGTLGQNVLIFVNNLSLGSSLSFYPLIDAKALYSGYSQLSE